MSKETAKTLKRQLNIVLFLVGSHYVSTTNIRDHLAALGIDVELRTIQRDLANLKEHFPLECRKDCMPHSWRWEKSTSPSGTLNVTQAVTLRLVEEQLQNLLSPRLIQELQPLFAQAKVVTGMATMTDQIDSIFNQPSGIAKAKSGKGFGVVPHSPLHDVLDGVRSWLGDVFAKSNKKDELATLNNALNELLVVMKAQGLEELMDGFKS